MAIGTGLALLGSAVISAGAGALGSSKQAKAAKQASQITQEDNAANRAFQTEIYNRNASALAPWQNQGLVANGAIMELLGFGPQQAQPAAFAGYGAPTAAPMAFSGGFDGFAPMGASYGGGALQNGRESMFLPDGYGAEGFGSPGFGGGTFGPGAASIPGQVTVPAPSARSAFDTYRGSTGYDFRFNEGLRALQSAFSRNLESGASTKAAIRFGQGIASDEFGRYMDLLRGQSQLGLSGASALAGVGQNFSGQVVAGNQAAANAAANARLYTGQLAANNLANLGSSFGSALGYFVK